MSLLTESFIREAASRRSLNESIRSINSFGRISEEEWFDIFLSHSYLDQELIAGIYNILTSQGLSVYVDWIVDPQLDRNNVTRESAELIRERMFHCRSLLYAISVAARMSRWMPWELGCVDGHTLHKCAILPISKVDTSSFVREEYLKLYPVVKRVDYSSSLFVTDSDDNNYGENIKNWIRK